jgi:hypothetical protein
MSLLPPEELIANLANTVIFENAADAARFWNFLTLVWPQKAGERVRWRGSVAKGRL